MYGAPVAGEGKPKVVDEKETTVYKRALDVSYNLRMKASRAVFHEINTKAPALPFALRCLLEGEGDKVGAAKRAACCVVRWAAAPW